MGETPVGPWVKEDWPTELSLGLLLQEHVTTIL